MSGAVKGETALVAGGEVGLVGENRAGVFSAAAAQQGCGQFNFEVDEQGVRRGKQEGAGIRALDGSAAKGQDDGIEFGEAGDGGMFAVAEGGFAVTCKDFGDGRLVLGFDHIVDIDEFPAKTACDERADGGFARAHEAGQDDAARSGDETRVGLGNVGHDGLQSLWCGAVCSV